MLRQVMVENGILQGIPSGDPRITVFKGVPFAAPPVGDLRWKNPQPAPDWEGVYKADTFADIPMMRVQPGSEAGDFYNKELNPTAVELPMSEDCLYLNIWTPAETAEEKLPVFFYIHGGGYQAGYSYEMEFDGERVARKGVVFVTVAYRLGLFGFLAHPELSAEDPSGPKGNFGLMDQAFGLQWVKRNIAAFGGDPNRITIAGQSAGASSVQAQITAPMNEGMIQGAIIQSGVSATFKDAEQTLIGFKPLEQAEQDGVEFVKSLGVGSIDEARKIDAFEIYRISEIAKGNTMRFRPTVDGVFQLEDPSSAYLNNRHHNIPLIVGHTMGETKSFGPFKQSYPETLAEFDTYATRYGEYADRFKQVCQVHSDEDVKTLFSRDAFSRLIAATRLFGYLQDYQGRTTYSYVFDHDIPGEDNAGSYHGSEMWFTFDSLNRCWRPFTGKHYDLARQASSYWVNFVKTGNPNGSDWMGFALPEWKPFTVDNQFILGFKDLPGEMDTQTDEVMKFRIDYTIGNL